MSFFLLVVFVGTAASVFTAKCLYSDSLTMGWKIWIFAAVLLSWFAPTYVRSLTQSDLMNYTVSGWIHNIGFYLFGTAFFLFSVLLIRNVLWYCAYGLFCVFNKPIAQMINPTQTQLLDRVNLITVGITFLISLYAVYEGVKVADVKEVTLKTDKVSEPFTFVQLSDIHIHRGVSNWKIDRLITRVNDLHPDAVLLTGDIGDDEAEKAAFIAQKLRNLNSRYGQFAVMGNHELYRGIKGWDHLFQSLGIRVLHNEGVILDRSDIYIAGITDASFSRRVKTLSPDIQKAMNSSSQDQFRILMSHSPLPHGKETKDYSALVDLQISGHTHGGQIFPFHFLVKPVNRYLAGLYDLNGSKSKIYVSRGTGYWGPPMRLFAPSEITLFKIVPSKAQTGADD